MRSTLTGLAAMLALVASGSALAVTCNSAAAVNNWSAVSTWSCGHVPANGDDVVITAGGTTTLDVNSNTLNSLTVNGTLAVGANLNVNNAATSFLTVNGSGTMTIGNSATARAVVVNSDITVAGTLTVGATAATHTLTAGGNLINSGTVNLEPAATRVCNITFNNAGSVAVSGSGSYNFNKITLNLGASSTNILDMQSPFTAIAGFLVITNGTYRHSTTSAVTPWIAAVTIPATGGFWLNNAAAVVTTTTGINVTVNGGLFKITTGTMTIGNTDSTRLILGPTASTLFEMDGGSLTVTGGISSSTTADPGTFTFTGGTILVQTINGGPVFSFQLGTGTTLNWSGGTFIAANGDGVADDVDIRSAVQNVTGGLLQLGMSGLASVNAISIINGAGGALNLPSILMVPQQAASPTALTLIEVHSTPINVLGGITIGPYANLDPNGGVVMNLGNGANNAVWTNNGTATMGSSTIFMTGSGTAASIGGSVATTFSGLTINNPNGVTINTTPTVNAAFTLTNGKVFTGANQINLGTAATVVTPSAASYVLGPIQKSYNAGALALVYPVGDAGNYTPVSITAGTTTTAGTLLVSTLTPDHPQITTPIPSTVIDANNDVNRYWRLNNTGLTVGTALTATFTFVASDLDPTATPAGFIVQRYDGTNWNPTTLVAANPLSTQASNITPLVAGNNDFAVGDAIAGLTAVPGAFNTFETSTPVAAVDGHIYTKVVGTAITLSVIALNATRNAVNTAYTTNPITVALLDAHDNTGALTVATACRSSWTTVISTQALSPAWASGRATVTITAPVAAWSNVRVRVTQGANSGCSTDAFAIRPLSFTVVTSSDATNTGTGGTPIIKTGANFHLTVSTPVTGYNGTPLIDNSTGMIVGTTTQGMIGGVFGAATSSGGVSTATGAGFFYSEVGNFGLNAGAVYDNGFTAVDQSLGDCVASSISNSLSGGEYGCNIGSVAIPQTTGSSGFGRFIPDNFGVTFNTPAFAPACGSGLFTYVGQPFNYSTQPVFTVTARNGTNNGLANATTTNYAGAYMNLTNASLAQGGYGTQAGRYSSFDTLGGGMTPLLNLAPLTTGLPSTASDPAFNLPLGVQPSPGVNTLTFSSGTGLNFIRATPVANFTASIALSLSVIDTDGVVYAGNPASFTSLPLTAMNGIAFAPAAGNNNYYGRMRMNNANGSELLPLTITLNTQYYNGSVFVPNTADNCTVLPVGSVGEGNYFGNIVAGTVTPSIGTLTFVGGANTLVLSKPGAGKTGALDLVLNLENTNTPVSCFAIAGVSATTGANLTYLHDIKSCSSPSYSQDPTAHATFGIYNNNPNSIYLRENY
jgi:hypothetical protein